jgi:hypothetical protein
MCRTSLRQSRYNSRLVRFMGPIVSRNELENTMRTCCLTDDIICSGVTHRQFGGVFWCTISQKVCLSIITKTTLMEQANIGRRRDKSPEWCMQRSRLGGNSRCSPPGNTRCSQGLVLWWCCVRSVWEVTSVCNVVTNLKFPWSRDGWRTHAKLITYGQVSCPLPLCFQLLRCYSCVQVSCFVIKQNNMRGWWRVREEPSHQKAKGNCISCV